MGLCHAIEEGVTDYMNGASGFDNKWISPLNGEQKVIAWSRQSWAAEAVSFILCKCESVNVTESASRMVDASVEFQIFCKAEGQEFGEFEVTDGTGDCDKLTYVSPLIEDTEHARLIAKFNAEQILGVLGAGTMAELITGIEGALPTYTGTESGVCSGACPVMGINYVEIGDHMTSSQGAMIRDEISIVLQGYVGEYGI